MFVNKNNISKCLSLINSEIDNRFQLLAQTLSSNIEKYHSSKLIDRETFAYKPYIIILAEELYEYMTFFEKNSEYSFFRILQIGYATGVNIIATTKYSHLINKNRKNDFQSCIKFQDKTSEPIIIRQK